MNRKQKTVLLCTAAVIALMVLFPPYVVEDYKHMPVKSGYGLIFVLPPYTYRAPEYGYELEEDGMCEHSIPATVNVSTLSTQVIGALLVGGLVCFAFKNG